MDNHDPLTVEGKAADWLTGCQRDLSSSFTPEVIEETGKATGRADIEQIFIPTLISPIF